MSKKARIVKGSGGFGGPLEIGIEGKKDKVMYVTGGHRPEIVDKICEITGGSPINGFETSVPEDEIMVAVIDCGGTLRCGIYPQKGIPTVNIMATGKSGPLRQHITEDIYVSNVDVNQVSAVDESNSSERAELTALTEKTKEDATASYTRDKKSWKQEQNKKINPS